MPIYEYRCPDCDNYSELSLTIDEYSGIEMVECNCGSAMVRIFSFSVKPIMVEHMNRTTGQLVSSEKQFADQLKRQSEEASIRTGIEHNFVPVDTQDKATLGVTDAGLRETYDRRKKLGMAIPKVIRPENMT